MLPGFLRTKNKLVFPGRRPGFDPQHFAARGGDLAPGHGCSLVAMPGATEFFDLVSGKKSVGTGTITNSISPYAGPSIQYTSGSGKGTISGMSTVNDGTVTFAAIVIPGTLGASGAVIGNSNTFNTGCALSIQGAGQVSVQYYGPSGTLFGSGNCKVTANVPSFIAISIANVANTKVPEVCLDLNTGKLQTNTQSLASTFTATAPDGTYVLGFNTGNAVRFPGFIAAAAFIPGVNLSLSELVEWAFDPWSFWYPPAVENLMQSAFTPPVTPPPSMIFNQTMTINLSGTLTLKGRG